MARTRQAMTFEVMATVTIDPLFCISSTMRQFPPRRIVCPPKKPSRRCICSASRTGSSASPATRCGRPGSGARSREYRRSSRRTSRKSWRRARPRARLLRFAGRIAAELVRAGVAIHVFNQRDIAGIIAMIRTLGALVDATAAPTSSRPAMKPGLPASPPPPGPHPDQKSISRNGTIP